MHVEVRRGAYHDSVTLMQVSRDVATVDGVAAAQVAMGTGLNLDLMRGMGFDPPAEAGPNDLVVAVRADDDGSLQAALARLDSALTASSAGSSDGLGGRDPEPRTVTSAVRRSAEEPTLALVSVPGPHAFTEAWSALQAGLSVLVFSDNVPVEQEVRLKDEAARLGLLVMGPDCGTAVVGGVGLGFANAVRPGPVGLVAASGTGAQQVMCMLDTREVGVSHCLGVGGRDLSSAVGGRSTRAALALLDDDPGTELIVLVSKPPDPVVAAEVTAFAESLTTPVLMALLGPEQPDLTDVARRAVEAVGGTWAEPWSWDGQPPPTGGTALRGLFAGGTLCDEAMLIASAALGQVRSNIPLHPDWAVGPDLRADGHLMLDFGDDALTQGRAHPMIDQRTRLDRIAVEAADPSCAVLLLDVVLGHAAHPDPAAELAPALAEARSTARDDGRELAVVVSLCATVDEPQDPRRQAEALHDAGAAVFLSNAAAARHAVSLLQTPAATA
ncbi:MAG TPA: FdrA family protein [Actinomycetes bacterium]